jgi:hypothetical protein
MTNESPGIVTVTGNGNPPAQTDAVRKICILGFADSRDQAPFADKGWEIWGVNDVYAHVPRVNKTFELHHLKGLVDGGRRNQKYIEWMQKGKMPLFMLRHHPEFPSSIPFPFEVVRENFPRAYFTNSISWMMALAILELTHIAEISDENGNTFRYRLARPGCELSLFGIDMAASTEFGSQRPSCEYFVGIADGCGLPCFIPDNSDLCKATALYGIDTTAPLRVKAESRIVEVKNAMAQVDQQLLMMQQQRENLVFQKGLLQGQKDAWKHIRSNWTMPTDIGVGEVIEGKAHHQLAAPTSAAPQGNGQVLEPIAKEN